MFPPCKTANRPDGADGDNRKAIAIAYEDTYTNPLAVWFEQYRTRQAVKLVCIAKNKASPYALRM